MPVLLATSADLPKPDRYTAWCAVAPAVPALPAGTRRKNFAHELEQALDAAFPAWSELGQRLARDSGARLAHAPTAGHNVSDLGLMLAWRNLIGQWAKDPETTLIVCDDPWAFRAFAEISDVSAGAAPSLRKTEIRASLRGAAARLSTAFRVGLAWARLRRRGSPPWGHATLLVYGHPASKPDGLDAYFGDLMAIRPDLVRILHTDCGLAKAREFMSGGRTWSLHAFGNLIALCKMPFVRWRPNYPSDDPSLVWLLRRASALENSRGGIAMSFWQNTCQTAWVDAVRPQVIVWPWEHHGWERNLIRRARAFDLKTVGYQHATFGRQERNHSPLSDPDGVASLPDTVATCGAAWSERLATFGVPEDRIIVAGAWRYPSPPKIPHDPSAPVFVALPAHHAIAAQLVDAIRPLASFERPFLVKDHPLTPIDVAPSPGIVKTDVPLTAQPALRAVVYCSSTVGLEAQLAGLPTIRFLPVGLVGSDIMPDGWPNSTADAATLGDALTNTAPPPAIDFETAFTPVDVPRWRRLLVADGSLANAAPPLPSGRLGSVRRKLRQLREDPTLRTWLRQKLLGRAAPAPDITHRRPPYLNGVRKEGTGARTDALFPESPATAPTTPLEMRLPGRTFILEPGDEKWLFAAPQDDSETWLGLQRFAWLPLAGPSINGAWVRTLYAEWKRRFSAARGGWAWQPYTAAERALNLIDVAVRHGAPEDPNAFAALLRQHAEEIVARLEYGGERYTGNHLGNNGRGLYRIGLALGDEALTDEGFLILGTEAERIFDASGILREGSSHYHLIVTRWYADAWLDARRHKRPEAATLEALARRCLSVVPSLALPGGLPLVGDISPDSPPPFLFSQDGFGGTWLASMTTDDRAALLTLIPDTGANISEAGWHRVQSGDWSALWHVPRDGWPPMPGHGHQDLGSCEIHWRDVPLFIDPGRGRYGDEGEAARYRSADVHGTLTIDGLDPYPTNRPYYDDAFRRSVVPVPPAFKTAGDSAQLRHYGYTRLGDVGAVTRHWAFHPTGLSIRDRVFGQGTHTIRRQLVTPHPARIDGDRVLIETGNATFSVKGDNLSVSQMPVWQAYGVPSPGWSIYTTVRMGLPFDKEIRIDLEDTAA